ncbi:hypothetical protein M0811_06559 [Anaeramoeba ignava]|uniref:Uncharacterized protein n=1 Tax=Anaeramoeba ignava TaxID=1746090 RepID=A0A9Q0LMU7_ANAIG|nr:hypothetical protein M0811_06559 [Anaeramoeba ignava]
MYFIITREILKTINLFLSKMNSLKSHWRICVSNAVGLSDFRNRIWNWIDHHCGVHEFCTEFSQNPKCTEPEFRDTQSKIEDTQTRERLEIFLDKEFSQNN